MPPPPMYSYKCTECSQELDVLRPFAESDKGPDKEDEKDLKECKDNKQDHSWKKVLHKFLVNKSFGWGSKGNWLILLSLFGSL